MKIRNCFVSNSSSSSFVVARSVVGDERFEKLVKLLEDYENSDEREQYDDFIFESNMNYVSLKYSYHDEGVSDILYKQMDFDCKKDEYLITD